MASLVSMLAASAEGGFHAPGIDEFLPPEIFAGFHRINLVQLISFLALVTVLLVYSNRAKLVPGRAQTAMEAIFDFVYINICEEVMGKTTGRRYAPIVTTIFLCVLFANLTGIVPGLNIAGSSRIAVPLVLAILAFLTFIIAGIKAQGFGGFFRSSLFPSGVPKPIFVILTPIEFFSTFVVRPVSLVIRLLANMIAGHMLLAVAFIGTEYLLLHAGNALFIPLGVATFLASAAGIFFELFVAALQAYIFAILTAVYINLSVHAH